VWQVPSTMRAAVVHHHKDQFSIEKLPVPDPGPDQVRRTSVWAAL
jgi:D-arabinose 1-dehydrogenase-like Zn-dependent alcohol dehydrogenase